MKIRNKKRKKLNSNVVVIKDFYWIEIYKKEKDMSTRNNVVYIILFILTIPLAWLLFNMAMSV